jgi:predicted secreted protein
MWRITLAALLIGGCAIAASILRITENDGGKTFEMKVGDTFELSLKMASGTGYIWELSPVDTHLLQADERRTLADNPSMPGAPVRVIWPFKALAAGRTTLTALLVRPWMRDQPAEKFQATIVIR